MSQRIVIDSVAFARDSGVLQGKLPVASLLRVLDMLVGSSGELTYRLEGGTGSLKRPQLVVEVKGTLPVCCQRCLEAIEYPVDVRSILEFVSSEDELTQEEIEDDSKDFLVVQSDLDVVELIEDEIILDLPSADRKSVV